MRGTFTRFSGACKWPSLRQSHLGFFRVAVATLLFHVGMALDGLAPGATESHSAGAWQGVTSLFSIQAWAVLHIICALLIVAGMYRPRFRLARLGFLATTCVSGGMAASFLYGTFRYEDASAAGFVFSLFVCLVAAAAYLEPTDVLPVKSGSIREFFEKIDD